MGLLHRKTLVRTYSSRRQMERGIARMTSKGYTMTNHSGEFSSRLFKPRRKWDKVVVTFTRNDDTA